MLTTLTINGKEVEKVDVIKTSPLVIFPADPGAGYILAHLELNHIVLTTRTKAFAVQARRELSGLDFTDAEAYTDPIREAQERYLEL